MQFNFPDLWSKVSGKYGIATSVVIIVAVAILLLLGIVDLAFVMELIGGSGE